MRLITLLMASLFAAFTASAASGQEYPSRRVTIVVPYAPGGISDIAARILGNKLSEIWKQPVVIENRPGGAGEIGTLTVAKSAPDGYTLLMGTVSEYSITYHLYPSYPLNPLKDLVPIVLVSDTAMVFAANAAAPFNTVKEMMAYANAQPDGLPYASAGVGTLSHLIAARFAFETHTKMLPVQYKGGGPAGTALAGGEVPMASLAASSVTPFVKSGLVKIIAVTTAQRIPSAPDWPTIAESGIPGFAASNWTALGAPAGTPRDIIEKINADANRALKMADLRQRLVAIGSMALGSTSKEADDKMRNESARYEKLIKAINLKLAL